MRVVPALAVLSFVRAPLAGLALAIALWRGAHGPPATSSAAPATRTIPSGDERIVRPIERARAAPEPGSGAIAGGRPEARSLHAGPVGGHRP